MANPIKGEIGLDIAGKRYRFVLNTYALAALERRMGMSWPKIMQTAMDQGFGYDHALAIFHAGLLRYHEMTERDAGDLLDELTVDRFANVFVEAVKLMMPEDIGNPPEMVASNGRGIERSAIGS